MAKRNLSPVATYVERGYGQVEPNHLSAQRTAQIYAQLPAHADITVLENGQFVKYDYASGLVNTLKTNPNAKGEWMLVFNEVKLYRDHEDYNDFAMKREDYVARVYSPGTDVLGYANARNYNGVVNAYEHDITSTTNPYVIEQRGTEIITEVEGQDPIKTVLPYAPMSEGTKMVPRVFKTNVGDIFTTNTIALEVDAEGNVLESELAKIAATKCLAPNADGYLAPAADDAQGMFGKMVKVFPFPYLQSAVELIRIPEKRRK
jgi:hypothetical protein